LIALLLPAVQAAREAARRSQCINNMKQVGLALHNYHDSNKTFPPGQIFEDGAKPPDALGPYHHTWVTKILPYLEQGPLYDQMETRLPVWDFFDVDGDSDTNEAVPFAQQQVADLLCPSDAGYSSPDDLLSKANRGNDYRAGITCYPGSVGYHWWPTAQWNAQNAIEAEFPGTANHDYSGVFTDLATNAIKDITDGTSNTIMCAEVNTTGFKAAAGPNGGAIRTCGTGVPRDPTRQGVFRAAFVDHPYGGTGERSQYVNFDKSATSGGTGMWVKASPYLFAPIYLAAWGPNTNWPGASSFHPGIVNVLNADGSVDSLSETIKWDIYLFRNGIHDGQVKQ
jgi:hypothetical protein